MERTKRRLTYLMIEANTACSLKCLHCTRASLEDQGLRAPFVMDRERFAAVLAKFAAYPIDTIKFEGLSEPMLHPQFDLLAADLRKTFPKAFVIIATNCQYAAERTPLLRTLPAVDMVYLSIDGTHERYERQRPGADYARLLRTLAYLRREVPETVRRQKLHINAVIDDDNVGELPALYRLKDEFGLAGVRINLAQNWSQDAGKHPGFAPATLAALKPYAADLKGVGGWEFRDCFWPFEGMVVDAFGDVRQCVLCTTAPSLGNIFEQDIDELLESPAYRELRRALHSNTPGRYCQSCAYAHLSPVLAQLQAALAEKPSPRAFEVKV